MLQTWKIILTNWINCYFKETNKKDLTLNLESLLDIISHLRENLNSSASNSSLLDSQTVQEFLVEKYPDFKFENGTVEPDNEEDVCLAASLLLFFVCVNSKNIDIKNAMCSKLSSGDQEIILKFSKHLMECPKITINDVLTAIFESCGQHTPKSEAKSLRVMVAETPPALRSLHNEVRRLQAALDAERFDRTYLQDELTRTNTKVEKLLKDKEQFKLEIVNLKAQLSLSSGQDRECHGDNIEDSNTIKLTKQLEQTEERLLSTQEQLEDVQNEREAYKTKLNQLKSEYDKLFSHSQQESTRVMTLSEELATERRHTHSLQELVAELQQHNHLNRMDSSLLECDDPDASIHSMQHNSSACSEVCTNVIEVQLGEERATIVALKHQMQSLQEQLKELIEKSEEDKRTFTAIISEKENTIMDLKHRVNEEIEEKNTLKSIFDDEVAKLNNELNELEQRLKGSQENSRNIIEKKMQEIQNLQEEKLSLLQSLSDETTKLENYIKDLQYEIDVEKTSKIRLREDYDNHIMKLNEKVLNRNNELLEQQNEILQKGEKIEDLQFQLRREKELRDDLSNKHNNDIKQLNSVKERFEQDLQQKSEEASDLHKYLQQHISIIEQLNKENDHIKTVILQLQEDCKILKENKEKLLVEIKNRDVKADQIYKEAENLRNLHFEEKQNLQYNLDEMKETVITLQVQLQDEIQLKVEVQQELQKSEDKNSYLSEEITKLNAIVEEHKLELEEKEKLITKLNESLIEKEKVIESLMKDLTEVNIQSEKLVQETVESNNIIKDLKIELEKSQSDYHENILSKDVIIKSLEIKLASEISEKDKLQALCNSLDKDNAVSLELLNEKDEKILQMQSDYNIMLAECEDNMQKLAAKEKQIQNEHDSVKELLKEKDLEIVHLKTKNRNVQQILEEGQLDSTKLKETYNLTLESKNRAIHTLQQENQSLNNELNDVRIQLETKVHSLKDKLIDNEHLIDKLKKTHDCQIENLNTMVNKLSNYLKDKTIEIDSVRKEKEKLQQVVADNADLIKTLEEEVKSLKHDQEKLLGDIESERLVLKNMVTVTESVMEDQKVSLNKVISEHLKSNEILQEQNKALQNLVDSEMKNAEIQIKDKENAIDAALKELCNLKLEKSEMASQVHLLTENITRLEHDLGMKEEQIKVVTEENKELNNQLSKYKNELETTEEELALLRQNQEKLTEDFESERLVLKNMMTVTESVMEDQKINLNKIISEHLKSNEILQEENKTLQSLLESEKKNAETLIKNMEIANNEMINHLNNLKGEKDDLGKKLTSQVDFFTDNLSKLKIDLHLKEEQLQEVIRENIELKSLLKKYENDISDLEKRSDEWKIQKDTTEAEITNELKTMKNELTEKCNINKQLETLLQEKIQICNESQATVKILNDRIADLDKQRAALEQEKSDYVFKLDEMKMNLEAHAQKENDELAQLKIDKKCLLDVLEDKKSEIVKLESLLMYEKQQIKLLQDENNNEKVNLANKCGILEEYQSKADQELENRQKEIELLLEEVKQEKEKAEKILRDRDELIARLCQEKDALISKLSKELIGEREKSSKEVESKAIAITELTKKLEDATRSETDTVKLLRKENELLKRTLALKETFAVASHENSSFKSAVQEPDVRNHHQVDTTPTDHTHSSLEHYKTVADLEKIIQDRNRTITGLQSDITYLKSMMAESEIQLLDVTKDLELSKDNCQHLSGQLKKIVHQKNEEIADLKKQLTKMSATENRASQIIKVSAKYQAMILKRIAEIKSNTVLKELTNFGNSANCDNELRRSLNAGTVTMEDLENFLDTTDRHLRRCSEKQLALQKERDRLTEVNKINESEIINMKKFLTELSVSVKTFNSVKEVYSQKLGRVVSLQRTVLREIRCLDGQLTDSTMCQLHRDYARAMQDLAECAMNLERWVERSIGRAVSAEKIKQAFTSDERFSLAPTAFQNESLEIQLEELEKYFCKLLEEVARAQKNDKKDVQAVTMTEVRAEYEDKLNRMKAKMKQLYHEQIEIFKEKQKEEIVSLEQELQKARDKLEESSRGYEEHIRALTTELWNVGEKFLMKNAEAEWLRKKQRCGSLMSLQHVHSSGLAPPQEIVSRPSDTHSLHSLPVSSNTNPKNEARGLHMSDEEGEVFDNRCVRELASTPRAAPRPAHRLSELQWRNSLCPPHLKSSYPAETQFAPAVHEEDIKCVAAPSMSLGGRGQRKEVGITAYKKPGPPTPSKQAGRLSATDSELRESLRVECEPNASRKTSTPSRIRALFRSNKADTVEGTPRSRRLSNIFRKK